MWGPMISRRRNQIAFRRKLAAERRSGIRAAMPSKVLVTRALPEEAQEMLDRSGLALDVWERDSPMDRDQLVSRAGGSRGILSALTDRIDLEVMERSDQLQIVSNWAVGFDNIDVAAATERSVWVGNTPDVLTETTADIVFGLLIAAARRLGEAERLVRSGGWSTWDPNLLLGQDVWGATIGLVGMGRIARAVARRAAGFGMRVVYWSRTRLSEDEAQRAGLIWCESLDQLLRESDFVSLHVPLSADTRRLIGARELGLMKSTAVLVNTGRGGLVDQAALADALRSGLIAAAGLDVTDPEPIGATDPLLDLENVVIVPHIGSATRATRTKMAVMAVENLLAGLDGKVPPHCVNPEARVSG